MNRIVFLGTGGARYVVFQQILASGGMWMEIDGTKLLVDPGPGSLVRMRSRTEKLDPRELDGVALSHSHLDHSGDFNIVVEAMTNGGFSKRGAVFLPGEALAEAGVFLEYLKGCVNRIEVLREGGTYKLGNIEITTPYRHIHGVETYGMNILSGDRTVSYVADSRFSEKLAEVYRCEVLILNTMRAKPSNLDHLCLPDAERIVRDARPKLAVLTHFGMSMLRAGPDLVASEMSLKTGTAVVAARDGATLDLEQLSLDSGSS